MKDQDSVLTVFSGLLILMVVFCAHNLQCLGSDTGESDGGSSLRQQGL